MEARMKIKEILNLSQEEMIKKLAEFKEELFNLRCQKAIHQLNNPMRIRHLKKDIARILTVLNSKKGGLVNARSFKKTC
jgi:large subunit ribosomal protein L29